MRILAIDTSSSSSSLSAALASEQGLIGEFGLHTGKQHSEALLPLLDGLLHAADLRLADLDALAVTIGPGSFTGLRIGLATVKAWVQALALPLCAISSLEALAYTAAEQGKLVCPILDARRNELYAALFEDGLRLTTDLAVAPAQLAEQLADYRRPILFTGDGLTSAGALLAEQLGPNMVAAPEQRRLFMAGAAALLARRDYQAGNFVDAAQLTPRYLRLSEPEEKLRAQAAQQELP